MDINESIFKLFNCITHQIGDMIDVITSGHKCKIADVYTEYDGYYLSVDNDIVNYAYLIEDIIKNYTYVQIDYINNNLIANNIKDRQLWYKAIKCLGAV